MISIKYFSANKSSQLQFNPKVQHKLRYFILYLVEIR